VHDVSHRVSSDRLSTRSLGACLSNRRHAPRWSAYWIATLTALAGAAVLIYWDWTARPLWVDEEMILLNVRGRALGRLAGPLWLDQSAPLGWLALERLVLLTFGSGERAVRMVNVLFGIGTLVTAVWIGRRWMSPVGAAILALLCSIGEWLVFFTLELKHYSADAFWALLLPALGAWTLDAAPDLSADVSSQLTGRVAVWWTVASVGMWFGNGALFVTPACAAVLLIECWRRGWRAALWTSILGIAWLASFGLNYTLVLRHALGNPYLQNFWAFAFPPASAGVAGTLRWLLGQFEPFAVKPAGSGLWVMFWVASTTGIIFAIATRRALGLMLATVPLSAVALALLRLVPTMERLSLWVVPALYVGVGLCAEASLSLGRRQYSRGRPAGLFFAVAAAVTTIAVSVDILRRGAASLEARPHSNYGLDDRRSVRFLMAVRRPGDVLMTTHFGLAAVWWYGRLSVSGPDRGGSLVDGSPIFEVGYRSPGRDCEQGTDEMNAALGGHSRVVVYLGFRQNVEPPGFDDLVLETLGRRGALVTYQGYADKSRIAVFDLGVAPLEKLVIPLEPGSEPAKVPAATGCVGAKPARRW
jgi:hypothetical protein